MTSSAYITILGRSKWALINTFYSVLRERKYYPDKIYIVTEHIYCTELDRTIDAIKLISQEFGLKPEIDSIVVSDVDFLEAGREIFNLVKELKSENARIAIDITPGRRALVAAALLPAMKLKIDHVFYLEIKDTSDAAKPFMMIPLEIQKIHDFIEKAKEVME
jgi:predicted signal transduction protein with EAL and GGDEF domain